jgi:hypothetical protein
MLASLGLTYRMDGRVGAMSFIAEPINGKFV